MQKSIKWALAVTGTMIAALLAILWMLFDGMDNGKFIGFILILIAMYIGLKAGADESQHERNSGSEDS